jgi:DNA-binding Lrp family transcriptional regulator
MAAGHSRSLVESLNRMGAVRDVSRVTGPYDVIAVLEVQDLDEVSNTVTDIIHTREGVVRTITCVALG